MNDKRERELLDIIDKQQKTIDALTEQLETMHFRVNQMSRRIYGNVSERFTDDIDQQRIPDLFPDEAVGTANNDAPCINPDRTNKESKLAKKPNAAPSENKRGGRMKIPDHLPCKEITLDPIGEQKVDAEGQQLVKLRTETTEKLDYVAGGFQKLIIHRPVYGIPNSDHMTISESPSPQIVEKGLPTDRTVALVLCEKFDLHNPLYRQTSRFERAGVPIGRATLSHWLKKAGVFLQPMATAIEQELVSSDVIHLDDTTIERLTPNSGKTHTARFWGYLNDRACVVQYSDNRSSNTPLALLSQWSGTIVADAYIGHEKLYRDAHHPKKHAPCLLHVRRKFYEAWKDAGDSRAQEVLEQFRQLYEIERRPLNLHEKKQCRQVEARPILNTLHHRIHQLSMVATPKSPLGRACAYFLKLWTRIPTYVTNGHIPIDNNPLERLWKPVALGRKNYLFVGNDEGGERAALFYTITLTCRVHDIDPYLYLTDIIPALHRDEDPATLTPHQWAIRNKTVRRNVHVA